MPNYITIPASGIGTVTPNVATDNVDSVHYQYMKLVDGTPGGSGYITGSTTNGLLVEVSRINNTVSGIFSVSGVVDVLGTVAISSIAAGDNNIGNIDIASIAAGDNNIGNVDIVTMPGIVVEDDPSSGGLNSILIAGIRNDAASVRTSDTGDFGNLSIDSVGRLGITDLGGSVSIDDNNSSITIDNAALSQTGGGTETSALRVTIANNSTGVLSVDDNGSSLTVDGTVNVNASNGFPPIVVAGNPIDTDGIHILGSDGSNAQILSTNSSGHINIADGGNTITVDGTVNAIQSGTWNVTTLGTITNVVHVDDNGSTISIDDGSGSITIDGSISISSIAAGTNNIGDIDVLSVPAPLSTTGGGTEAAALRVTIATDSTGVLSVDDNGSSLTVDGTVTANAGTGTFTTKETRSSSPSQSTVASSATNVTILASNSNRLGATIYNDSSVILYLKLGSTASTTSFTIKMQAESYYEVPFNYTGIIEGLWASATGNARITELT